MEGEPIRALDLDALARPAAGDWPPAPPLPIDRTAPRRRLAVCVASGDLVGPINNGGVGTAYTALAEALAADGHRVTALFLQGRRCEQRNFTHWVAWYRERGVELAPLEPADVPLANSTNVQTADAAYQWLRRRRFDVVHFPEMGGAAYCCLLAKRLGEAFGETTFVVGTHSPTAWQRQGNQELLETYEDLETDFMERRCLELADVAWSPSQYLLRWERDRDWKMPARTCVQPYLPPDALGPPPALGPVHEIVFFGRLEERKGLVLFCDALDRLAAGAPASTPGLRIVFLGKEARVHGLRSRKYLTARAKRWPFPIEVVSDRDRRGATEFLRQPGRLAVMPSLMENLPFTVIECLREGIPFVASPAGGIPELIEAGQRGRLLVPLRADLWAEALARVLTQGPERGRLAFDADANRAAWLDWHAHLPAPDERRGVSPPVRVDRRADAAPLVSVCMPHHNRPRLLAQALDSLRQQDYSNLEVVLVDDASTDPVARAYLDQLEPEFQERGWRLQRSPVNRFAAATRNAAARLARGEYLLFMDDDNVAKPHEVSTLVRAALHSGADFVGCFVDLFEGEAPPSGRPASRYAFLGPAVSLGLWRNALGDTNTLMRREAFFALRGFTEDYGVSHEDHELLVRAVLNGFRLEILPESLFWYRRTPNSVHHSADPAANVLRSLRPYLKAVPPELRPALLLAQGLLAREIAPTKWRGAALHYRLADWLVGALRKRPRLFGLARSAARWAADLLRRPPTPDRSEPRISLPDAPARAA